MDISQEFACSDTTGAVASVVQHEEEALSFSQQGASAMPKQKPSPNPLTARRADLPLSLAGTQTIYCGDNLKQLQRLPPECVDLIYIDPPFNSNRNYEVFWGEKKEQRAFEDRHASTKAYIDFMRPRCVELARVLRKTGSFYYHCDWHASHYVSKLCSTRFLGRTTSRTKLSGGEPTHVPT
jgi:hypothetical protein